MKSFFTRLAIFLVTSFVLLNVLAAIYATLAQRRIERDGSEVYAAIRLAQQPSDAPALVLGDSVSHQLLFHAPLAHTLNLSTNQAISVAGQYLLAQQAVAHDAALKEIILAYQASSFTNDLQQPFTFNYFVKPFYTRAIFRPSMDALVTARLDRRPFYRLMVLPMFRNTDLLESTDYTATTPDPFTYFAPVSIDYLGRLRDLCVQHRIALRIVSTPISVARPVDLEILHREAAAAQLDDLFANYDATIRRVDAAQFLDNVHFTDGRIAENSALFVKMLGVQ